MIVGVYACASDVMRFWACLCVFHLKNRRAWRLLGAVLVDRGGGEAVADCVVGVVFELEVLG